MPPFQIAVAMSATLLHFITACHLMSDPPNSEGPWTPSSESYILELDGCNGSGKVYLHFTAPATGWYSSNGENGYVKESRDINFTLERRNTEYWILDASSTDEGHLHLLDIFESIEIDHGKLSSLQEITPINFYQNKNHLEELRIYCPENECDCDGYNIISKYCFSGTYMKKANSTNIFYNVEKNLTLSQVYFFDLWKIELEDKYIIAILEEGGICPHLTLNDSWSLVMSDDTLLYEANSYTECIKRPKFPRNLLKSKKRKLLDTGHPSLPPNFNKTLALGNLKLRAKQLKFGDEEDQ